MCCEPKGHGHGPGHSHGAESCCCGGGGAVSFRRMFYSKKERIEKLEAYLKELEAEIKEVEKRIKEIKEDWQINVNWNAFPQAFFFLQFNIFQFTTGEEKMKEKVNSNIFINLNIILEGL